MNERIRKDICRVLIITLALILALNNVTYVSADGDDPTQITITRIGDVYEYGYDSNPVSGYNQSAHFSSSIGAGIAFCGCAAIPSPISSAGESFTYNNPSVVNDENIRKVLYYGWKGPEQWSGFKEYGEYYRYNFLSQVGVKTNEEACGVCVTSMVLSDAYGAVNYSYDMAGKEPFVDFIASKPNAPKSFRVYMCPSPNGHGVAQDMFTWDYMPFGKVSVKKQNLSNSDLVKQLPNIYSLKGAEYTVFGADKREVGKLVTDDKGNTQELELEEGTYTIVESKAPPGYDLDQNEYEVNIKGGETLSIESFDEPKTVVPEVFIQKIAAEDNVNKKLSLENAKFQVKYYETLDDIEGKGGFKKWIFRSDAEGLVKLTGDYFIDGDELFKDDNGNAVLPIGTYEFEEIEAPKGFALSEDVIVMKLEPDKNTAEITYNAPVFVEKEQTVNILIQKVDSETGLTVPQGLGSFEGAEFSVERVDEMEAQNEILPGSPFTTDMNGRIQLTGLRAGTYIIRETKAPSGYVINDEAKSVVARISEKNTAYFDYTVKVEESPITLEVFKLCYDLGGNVIPLSGAELCLIDEEGNTVDKWVSTSEAHSIKGIPYGKYYIREISAPEGFLRLNDDIPIEVLETDEVQSIEVINERTPEITTTAVFDNGLKATLFNEQIVAIDSVEMTNLTSGNTYELKGRIVNRFDSTEVFSESTISFVPEGSSQKAEMKFEIEEGEVKGKTVVAVQELYRNGELVAVHDNLFDEAQTLYIPRIETIAVDGKDEDKQILNMGTATIVDTIDYEGLVPGLEYIVRTTMFDRDTGAALVDRNGDKIVGNVNFKTELSSGVIEVPIEVDADLNSGKTIVLFEEILIGDEVVAEHKDIYDEAQTVRVTEVKTKAQAENGQPYIHEEGIQVITDIVEYENLIEGKTHTVRATLSDENGKLLRDEKGNIVSEELDFVPEKSSGEVTVRIMVNSDLIEGNKVVVFEEIMEDDEIVAVHKDIRAKSQTLLKVTLSSIATVNGKKSSVANEETKLTDIVKYDGLEAGRKYLIETQIVKVDDQQIVKSEKTNFIANGTSSQTEVSTTIDTSELADAELVVYETIYAYDDDGVAFKIAEHKDLKDATQTVKIKERETVKTGDFNSSITYMYSALISLFTLMVAIIYKKKFRVKD